MIISLALVYDFDAFGIHDTTSINQTRIVQCRSFWRIVCTDKAACLPVSVGLVMIDMVTNKFDKSGKLGRPIWILSNGPIVPSVLFEAAHSA